ncbi:MAG: outer membrane protein transport protein [Pseudoflavonifractor sp.]|nr:outer membrane protein transport protein [Alloprevotella sp.]MCM1117191.1 outer membrane protein transport protein [Pseudoflavonifractor sp.]
MRFTILATSLLLASGAALAQSAIDAYSLSRSDFKGTARFMSMGGAFGALGGDLSTLNQNPAGIGIYRSNDIGITLDLDLQHSSADTRGMSVKDNMIKFHVNNFGYVGAINTGSDVMPFLNFGASYTRANSFDRRFKGENPNLQASYSNYIAGVTSANGSYAGWNEKDLSATDTYNPYVDSWAPWMSILSYNAFLINPRPGTDPAQNQYQGLWKGDTYGDSQMSVEEKGYVDEYNINFGGNIMNTVYWGMGFGITDISYTQNAFYDEQLDNAAIPANQDVSSIVNGNAYYGLDSWKHITGTGFNFKIGFIFKPINELRLGLAVHTPTYYNLTQQSWSQVNYSFASDVQGYTETNDGWNYQIDWKLRTPWRLIASAAGVIGSQAIISFDYEYRPYQNMAIRNADNDPFQYAGDGSDYLKGDIEDYYQSSNIFRLGLEYRLSPSWSLRAGVNHETSPSTSYARSADADIYTEGPEDCGTMPSYTFDKETTYVTCGIGYRYKGFYLDGAYIYKNQKAQYRPFTPNNFTAIPDATDLTLASSQIVVSLGFRF